MTTYQGGKKRIGKKIFNVISLIDGYFNKDVKLPYFEPFVGMASVIKHFGVKNDRELYACDSNIDIIIMWKEIQKGWKPPLKCTKAKYEKLKHTKTHSAERGFIGSAASWAGIFFHAYRLNYTRSRDFMREGYNGVMNTKKDIMNVKFLNPSSYDTFKPTNFVVYCDPPYLGNNLGNSKSVFQSFDHKKFWETMRTWSKNNLVIISETSAPEDFKIIWSAVSSVKIKDSTKKYNDNLYVHKSIYENMSKRLLNEIKDKILFINYT